MKSKLIAALMALGTATAASAAVTVPQEYDAEGVTTTVVKNTQLQDELTATAAGTLCSATPGSLSGGNTWFDSTTTFTLNLEALEQLLIRQLNLGVPRAG